ncbi:MAG: hypothetical protein DRO06_04205 [Thermoproteota archaeon]|nr:MAG: hypothetical protein DRO06_04205 [Candidatus Korarchaeota archaeon]
MEGIRGGGGVSEPGVLPDDLLADLLPPDEVAEGRTVAVVECHEEIPCDSCLWACPVGAVEKEAVTSPPRVDWSRCTGCGNCVLACPGLAIFLVRLEGGTAYVSVPYEMLPIPERGDRVIALGRTGAELGEAEVVAVRRSEDGTAMVTVAVPRRLAHEVRAVRVP